MTGREGESVKGEEEGGRVEGGRVEGGREGEAGRGGEGDTDPFCCFTFQIVRAGSQQLNPGVSYGWQGPVT